MHILYPKYLGYIIVTYVNAKIAFGVTYEWFLTDSKIFEESVVIEESSRFLCLSFLN